ncbi:hypothetical protein IVB69_06520 [Flavobacterium sp. J49]|uniref:hypothetical protein n=1 Tax=Flavobacterium sp. J49 TaxID=2718534 RepID=UPI00159369A5|nr:hypothetical protein [Flavobacterium sp. J49]MBF6641127.1 hypothetical protein [Flavobacterium sp. J49]NIC02374.1 hypothetical protein [Flavobacterium sp. J49]
MKSLKIILFFVLFSAVQSHAQYGYGNSGMGMNRTNNGMPNTQQTPKEPTPEEIEKNRNEKIQGYMLLLKKDLTLDELQYIAIKNEVTTNSKRIDILLKSELSDEEKNNELKSIQEKMEKTILGYLNPDQKEKYQLLKIQKPDKKKKKNQGKAEQSEAKENESEK